MAKVLGIDLGTTVSCVAVMEGGEPLVLENSEGKRTTPSVVAFTKSGGRIIGDAAKRQAGINAPNTIYSIKRLMGCKFEEVQESTKRVPYKVVKSVNSDAWVEVEVEGKPKQFSPQEISAMILSKLKTDAEMRLGEKITQAVIAVPAYFNDCQRQATKDAGYIAGLEVLRIINEPIAASLAYGFDKKKTGIIGVYDLGGGMFSTSVLELGDGVFEVKAINGDTHLGGDDWDNRIMDWILDEFKKERGMNLCNQPDALQRIKEESEKAKIALSTSQLYEINLPFITTDASGLKQVRNTLTRIKMEQLCEDLFQRTIVPFRNCLKDAGLTGEELDGLIMVGGMTRMPRLVETARSLVNKPPHQGVNPDEVVAIGAAIQAGVFKGEVKNVLLLDVTPMSLGIETLGGVFTKLIERNTTIPTRKSEIFSTSTDNQFGMDIHVLQGESQFAKENKTIGGFQLTDIPAAPRGTPQVEVTIDIDANGTLYVAAKDLGTGKEKSIKIAHPTDSVPFQAKFPLPIWLQQSEDKEARPTLHTSESSTPTKTIVCPQCSGQLPTETKTCPTCGYSVSEKPIDAPSSIKREEKPSEETSEMAKPAKNLGETAKRSQNNHTGRRTLAIFVVIACCAVALIPQILNRQPRVPSNPTEAKPAPSTPPPNPPGQPAPPTTTPPPVTHGQGRLQQYDDFSFELKGCRLEDRLDKQVNDGKPHKQLVCDVLVKNMAGDRTLNMHGNVNGSRIRVIDDSGTEYDFSGGTLGTSPLSCYGFAWPDGANAALVLPSGVPVKATLIFGVKDGVGYFSPEARSLGVLDIGFISQDSTGEKPFHIQFEDAPVTRVEASKPIPGSDQVAPQDQGGLQQYDDFSFELWGCRLEDRMDKQVNDGKPHKQLVCDVLVKNMAGDRTLNMHGNVNGSRIRVIDDSGTEYDFSGGTLGTSPLSCYGFAWPDGANAALVLPSGVPVKATLFFGFKDGVGYFSPEARSLGVLDIGFISQDSTGEKPFHIQFKNIPISKDQLPPTRPQPTQLPSPAGILTIAQVKEMASAKFTDDNMITVIRQSGTVFHLTADDIIDLGKAGVSQKVISFMISSRPAVRQH